MIDMTKANERRIKRGATDWWIHEQAMVGRNGKTYKLEQVIRSIPREKGIKIWRPVVPIYAQDNLPVYWHEGV